MVGAAGWLTTVAVAGLFISDVDGLAGTGCTCRAGGFDGGVLGGFVRSIVLNCAGGMARAFASGVLSGRLTVGFLADFILAGGGKISLPVIRGFFDDGTLAGGTRRRTGGLVTGGSSIIQSPRLLLYRGFKRGIV